MVTGETWSSWETGILAHEAGGYVADPASRSSACVELQKNPPNAHARPGHVSAISNPGAQRPASRKLFLAPFSHMEPSVSQRTVSPF